MARVFDSPAEAAAQMEKFIVAQDKALIEAANGTIFVVWFRATNVYMAHGYWNKSYSTSLRRDPPNPPPGPLKWRSQRLRRAVKQVPAKGTGMNFFKGAVMVDSREAPYGRVHEEGAAIWHPALKIGGRPGLAINPYKVTRRLKFRLGRKNLIIHKGAIGRMIGIPARPYIAPAAKDAEGFFEEEASRKIRTLIARMF